MYHKLCEFSFQNVTGLHLKEVNINMFSSWQIVYKPLFEKQGLTIYSFLKLVISGGEYIPTTKGMSFIL
jgi:hypothetical protein